MRKILAVLMAVMMLVGALAALPVFATEEPVYTSSFDMTSSNEKIDDLIITEVVVNSKSGDAAIDSTFTNDAFDYIEVYNNSDREINLYDYEILSANSYSYFDGKSTGYDVSQTVNAALKYKFAYKNTLKSGTVAGEAGQHTFCQNPATAKLQPGEVGVIWFWNKQTEDYNKKQTAQNYVSGTDGKLAGFRKHYGMNDATVVVATNAMASGATALEADRVYALCYKMGLDASNVVTSNVSRQTNTWNVDVPAYDANTLLLNRAIVCLVEYTKETTAGIAVTSSSDAMAYGFDAFEHSSANYLPAYMKPDLYIQNEKNKIDDEEQKAAYDWHDFVFQDPASRVNQNGVGAPIGEGNHLAHSYRECAVAYYGLTEDGKAAATTPGKLPAWQWMYLNPAKIEALESAAYLAAEAVVTPLVGTTTTVAVNSLNVVSTVVIPVGTEINTENKATYVLAVFDDMMKFVVSDWTTADIKTEAGRLWTAANDTAAEPADKWETMCMTDYLDTYSIEMTDIDTGIEETKKDYAENFVDRDYLIEKHTKKNTTNTTDDEGGLPVWALILIIVGGVVVAAGIAVVVIIIIKKKNKPVAADDVAAEGEVEVIDAGETAAEENNQ